MESADALQGLKMMVFGFVWAADCVSKAVISHMSHPPPAQSCHTGSHDGLTVIKWLNGDTEEMGE